MPRRSPQLNASPHEIAAALARYESAHRAVTRPRQRNVWIASHLLIPSSQLGITLRDQALRLARRSLSPPGMSLQG